MQASPAVTQSLSSLLPGSNPPPKLISHAESLLALSRQRASHLKPDEEIARAYACCDIACQKLRAQLRLPLPKSGKAPCKPAVYKKLIKFLEGILNDDGEKATPKKRTANGQMKQPQPVQVDTPSKKQRNDKASFAGTIKASNSKSQEAGDDDAPDFVTPSIRTLCKALSTQTLVPHVYTGTSIVLHFADMWPTPDPPPGFRSDTLALIVALYLLVLTKMQKGKMTTQIYNKTVAKAGEVLVLEEEKHKVEGWIKRINREGWCKGQEWYGTVPEDVLDRDSMTDTAEVAEDDEDDLIPARRRIRRKNVEVDEEDPENVLLPGLGTMMQDAIDWTNDERQAEYKKWKQKIMKEMDALDKGSNGGRVEAAALA